MRTILNSSRVELKLLDDHEEVRLFTENAKHEDELISGPVA